MLKKGWHPRRLLSQLYRTFRARDRPTLLVLKKKFQSFFLIFHVLRRRSLPKFKILFEMSNVFNFQIIINFYFFVSGYSSCAAHKRIALQNRKQPNCGHNVKHQNVFKVQISNFKFDSIKSIKIT